MEQEFQKLLSHFYQFAKRRIGFNKDTAINFKSDPQNSIELLGKTAYYDPNQMEVTVYTINRHPKDVLRSIAHELVHHKQNCDGRMNNTGPTEPGYAQNDSHLRQLEEEAYLEGSMCFRDWEDSYKSNQEVKTIYESVVKNFTKEKLKMSTKEEMRTIVREAVSRVLTQNKIQEMDYEDDAYMDDLEKEFPFLKDDPEMGGRAPADVQRSMDDEMPAMAMDDEDEMMEGMCPTCGMSPCGCPMEEENVSEEISNLIATLGEEKVLELLRNVDEASTEKHNDNPALTGDQKDELPDHLQKAIIDAEEDSIKEQSTPWEQWGQQVQDILGGPQLLKVWDKLRELHKAGMTPEQAAEKVAVPKMGEAVEDDITSSEDRYGDMKHVIKGIRFSDNGDIEADVRKMEENEELADWLYGELGSGDVVADEFGNEYAGADIQDLLDTSDVELPDIAETQEDFYAQMRTDARTLSEDWNKSIRNKRSSLLNERLMKAWNFNK